MRKTCNNQSTILEEAIVSSLLDDGSMTRQQLVSRLSVRSATLFGSVRRLVEAGMLEEPERKGFKTGRKASPIRFLGDYLSFIGVELNMNRVVCVCLDAAGTQIGSTTLSIESEPGAAVARQSVEKAIQETVRSTASRNRRIGGIGFADPGVVDVERGIAIKAANIPGWENIDIGKWLTGKFNVPCRAWPAPSTRAYAEYESAGRPSSLFHLELGRGWEEDSSRTASFSSATHSQPWRLAILSWKTTDRFAVAATGAVLRPSPGSRGSAAAWKN